MKRLTLPYGVTRFVGCVWVAVLPLASVACAGSTSPSPVMTTYSGSFTGQGSFANGVDVVECTWTTTVTGTIKVVMQQNADGTVAGTLEMIGTSVPGAVQATGRFSCPNPTTLAINWGGPVTGTTGNIQFGITTGTVAVTFTGTLVNGVITGTVVNTDNGTVPTGFHTYSVTFPVTLR